MRQEYFAVYGEYPIDIKLSLSLRISAKKQKQILIQNHLTEHDWMDNLTLLSF